MRKLVAIATLSLLTAGGAVALASTANAHSGAAGNVTVTKATKSYNAPTMQATAVNVFQKGDVVNVACFTEGHQTDGTAIWLKVATDSGQREYVNRASVDVSGTDLPRC